MRILLLALFVVLISVATVTAQDQVTGVAESSGASQSQSASAGLLPEPRVIAKGVEFASRWGGGADGEGATGADGFYPELGNMISGAGWISAGPGYRRQLANGHVLVDGSAAVSWHTYKVAQGRFELTNLARNHVTVGSQVRWQDLTQVNYFGVGSDSLEASRSQYRLKSTDLVGYVVGRPNEWLSIVGRFGWLHQPTLDAPTGWFDGGYPDARQMFGGDPGMSRQPNFLHGDASVVADFRDNPGHPVTGGLYSAGFAVYSDRDDQRSSFQRYEVEALQFVPVIGRRWVIGLHGWGVFSRTDDTNQVPFYMLPSVGGRDTLRGYYDYRFHDRHLLAASAESRWAIFRDVDAAAFFDAGNVAARAGDLDLKKTSYGGGIRVHSRTSTLARFDVGRSRSEGWRMFFSLHDPLGLARLSRRTAVIPFVP